MGLLRKLTSRRGSKTPNKSSSGTSSVASSPTTSKISQGLPARPDRASPLPVARAASSVAPTSSPAEKASTAQDTSSHDVPVDQTSTSTTILTEAELSDSEADEDGGYITASEGEEDLHQLWRGAKPPDTAVNAAEESSRAEPEAAAADTKPALTSAGAPVTTAGTIEPSPVRAQDVSPRRPLGKPLAQLTAQDVALTPGEISADITIVWEALHLFLSSRMKEAEEICLTGSDHRLYFAVGYSLIQAIKSMATFEPDDLEDAIRCCRNTLHIAQLLRKQDYGLLARVGSLAKGSASAASVRAMTPTQRHAELVYAECTLLKATLSMAYSGDIVAFLKEALNMRSAYSTYRTLAQYVEAADGAFGGEDPKIDQDLRSGINLGNGMISLILSLLPSTVLKIMEVIGFAGDRDAALRMLMKPGGWRAGAEEPTMPPSAQGIRRPIADLVLLMYHLVIANYLPVGGVDLKTASTILRWNLERYPNGIFFLYYHGRLKSTETLLEDATKSFHRAIDAQKEYKQLGHICYWDLGLAALALGDWSHGYEYFGKLEAESNWSKAIYTYAKAVMLYEQDIEPKEVASSMEEVPRLLQRIAGKSIPLEKFVSRRARKFTSQQNRLLLAGLDLTYVLNCFGLCPGFVLHDVHLKQVDETITELDLVTDPTSYGQCTGEYWDDFCLAHMLRGVIYRVMTHPESYVVDRPPKGGIVSAHADAEALRSFELVLHHGKDIQHDHHLVWFTHYELGRLYHAQGLWERARYEYDLVLAGKHLETSTKKGKGKVSLQNMAVLRSNAGLQLLKEQGH
ncbi:hypothetical protein BMF94_5488 [Rhodotorula taiwanensis]|uniref:Tetratricopeptide repeat protein 39B n=1 Tax=Rhodotorula taiwanensis TaxID=741276 RepID=A0A2S5B315_9BASI|nr:hypothetical protein BMF94_5488 [Rhodotorula taiwanensis]